MYGLPLIIWSILFFCGLSQSAYSTQLLEIIKNHCCELVLCVPKYDLCPMQYGSRKSFFSFDGNFACRV